MISSGFNLMLPDWSEALRVEPHEHYDEAILGYDPLEDRLIYNEDKIIDILIIKEGMSVEDAIEYYEYNINGTQGKNTPTYIIPMG